MPKEQGMMGFAVATAPPMRRGIDGVPPAPPSSPDPAAASPSPRSPRRFNRKAFLRMMVGAGVAAAAVTGARILTEGGGREGPAAVAQSVDALAAVAKSQNHFNLVPGDLTILSEVPPTANIGDREKPISAVNPELQARAQKAGYSIVYQAVENDRTGRSVLAGKRQLYPAGLGSGGDDIGFGFFNGRVTGIFKGWTARPENPNVVSAILSNPLTKTDYAVSINLEGELDNPYIVLPTRFFVDDLDYGLEIIKQKSAEKAPEAAKNNTYLHSTYLTPEGLNPKDPSHVIRNMLNSGYTLDDLAKPGDFVLCGLLPDINKTKPYSQDKLGVSIAGSFSVRRFGGFSQWKNEAAPQKA